MSNAAFRHHEIKNDDTAAISPTRFDSHSTLNWTLESKLNRDTILNLMHEPSSISNEEQPKVARFHRNLFDGVIFRRSLRCHNLHTEVCMVALIPMARGTNPRAKSLREIHSNVKRIERKIEFNHGFMFDTRFRPSLCVYRKKSKSRELTGFDASAANRYELYSSSTFCHRLLRPLLVLC